MKKSLLLLVSLALSAVMLNAQSTNPLLKDSQKALKVENLTLQTAQFSLQDAATLEEFKVVPQKARGNGAYYRRPSGTLLAGMITQVMSTGDQLGASYFPIMIGPAFAPWTYRNASTGTPSSYDWSLITSEGGKITHWDAANEQPIFDVNANGDGTITWPGIGSFIKAQLDIPGSSYFHAQGVLSSSNNQQVPVSNLAGVAYEQQVQNGPFVEANYPMVDFDSNIGKLYVAGFEGHDGFSPGKIGELNTLSLIHLFEKPIAPVTFWQVEHLVFSESKMPIKSQDAYLTCTIYPINDEGKIQWTEPFATSEAWQDNVETTYTFSTGETINTIRFDFSETDPISGLLVDRNLVIDFPYAIEISWEDQLASDFDFTTMIVENMDKDSKSYVICDDNLLHYFGEHEIDVTIQLVGLYNTFELDNPDAAERTVDATGGLAVDAENYRNFFVISSYPLDEIEVKELPEWLSITTANGDEWEEYNALNYEITGEALPAGVEGRSGDVVFESKGTTVTINVKQGSGTGIDLVAKENVNVTYSENGISLAYPVAATSVDVYSVSGQRIAQYNLPSNGKYTIAASDLDKGVYILKFNGINATAKVMNK